MAVGRFKEVPRFLLVEADVFTWNVEFTFE